MIEPLPATPRLSTLFRSLPANLSWQTGDLHRLEIAVGGMAIDSRQVKPGDVFFALVGGNIDGHRFIPQAIQGGAVAVVGEKPYSDLAVPYIQVPDSRQALAHFSAAYFGFPSRKLTVIGVSGTDGKTTTASLIFNILKEAGIRAGMISTVNAVIGSQTLDTGFHVTTPDAQDVQRYLAQMVSSGMSHAVLEATSHGLAQHRVEGCEFDVGVVTNITHEHLDYHGSYEAYRSAKARLFDLIASKHDKDFQNLRLAVLNRDDTSYGYLADHIDRLERMLAVRFMRITYGVESDADLRATKIESDENGVQFVVTGLDYQFPVQSRLAGEYNVSNCLAAIAVTVAGLGLAPETAQAGISSLSAIPGRMEHLDLGTDFFTIVDFAHTPNALHRALTAARRIAESQGKAGRVIAVFGSAGLRDRAKRRMMAEVAAQLADLSVLTAEDPRTESLDEILAEMAKGSESRGGVEGKSFWRVPDRGDAIRFALSLAVPGDVVIVLGKGHEQSMCFGEVEYPWDDRTAVRAAVAELLGVQGPHMPFLPTKK